MFLPQVLIPVPAQNTHVVVRTLPPDPRHPLHCSTILSVSWQKPQDLPSISAMSLHFSFVIITVVDAKHISLTVILSFQKCFDFWEVLFVGLEQICVCVCGCVWMEQQVNYDFTE